MSRTEPKAGRASSRLGLLLAGMVGLSGSGAAGALPSAGCLDGGEPAAIAAVDDDLGLRLADGRIIIQAGIDAPHEWAARPAGRAAMARWLAGQPVSVRPLAAEPDRWGRTVARVFATPPEGGGRISVAEALLEAGLARVRPDGRTAACAAGDLALERRARATGLGLWADPRFAVIAAEDLPRLRAAVGSLAIVEGRIARIGQGRTRTYLSFGPDGRAGFAIALDRATTARLASSGRDVATWRGRTVRVRGVLDDRFGLQIELTSGDQIEFTDGR